jgi:hypothetical protein
MPLYDIVLAPSNAAHSIAASDAPLSSHTGFACRPIDHVKLATLAAQLGVATFESALQQLDPSVAASDDGPWVSVLPTSLLERVVSLAPAELQEAAAGWGATEEFALDRMGPAEAQQFLIALASLGRQARAEGASVFLWSCL